MSYEFAEAARDVAEQAHHQVNTALDRGENYSELEDALSLMEDVAGELRAALGEAEDLYDQVRERVEGLRERLDPDQDDTDGPLEEQFENAEFARDHEFENMTAEEIL